MIDLHSFARCSMLGGESNCIITSELANQRAPKALFTCVVYTKIYYQYSLLLIITILFTYCQVTVHHFNLFILLPFHPTTIIIMTFILYLLLSIFILENDRRKVEMSFFITRHV